MWSRLIRLCLGLSLGLGSGVTAGLLVSEPARAAEQVRMRYGLYELLITAQDLESFAQTGEATGDLSALVSRLGSERAAQFQ
ncbi:MAG: alpha/beta hydrolase, partial [Cyanobacteria bacterium J06650_10]